MRIATVTTEPERFELKTLPAEDDLEGGYIVARPLPYGMVLDRRDKGTKMGMELEVQQGSRRNNRRKSINQNEPETQKIELTTLSAWMANHDFAYCIVDHNLATKDGQKLDFHNPLHVQALDPKVGIEIDRILSELNEPEEDEETLEDFTTSATSSFPNDEVPSPA
jgi:hypothetical protein